MKKLFISLLAVAALASCAKEDVIVADPGELIAFNSFVENSTRANDPSYGAADNAQDLTAFNVWGTVAANASSAPVAIFANDTVTGTVGVNSTWTCTTNTQYWLNGATYKFAALANAGTVTLGTDLLPATVEFESTGSKDLIYAKSDTYTGKPAGENVKVAFNFEHLLSKVYIQVTNNSVAAKDYSFLVKNIKINAPKTAGKYYIQSVGEIPAKTWTATNGEYTFANIAVAGGVASAECAAEQLLIPGAATITFDVDIVVGGQTMSTAKYSHTATLAAANAYKFNIKVSVGDPIQFTVTEDPEWNYDLNGNGNTADDIITL